MRLPACGRSYIHNAVSQPARAQRSRLRVLPIEAILTVCGEPERLTVEQSRT